MLSQFGTARPLPNGRAGGFGPQAHPTRSEPPPSYQKELNQCLLEAQSMQMEKPRPDLQSCRDSRPQIGPSTPGGFRQPDFAPSELDRNFIF